MSWVTRCPCWLRAHFICVCRPYSVIKSVLSHSQFDLSNLQNPYLLLFKLPQMTSTNPKGGLSPTQVAVGWFTVLQFRGKNQTWRLCCRGSSTDFCLSHCKEVIWPYTASLICGRKEVICWNERHITNQILSVALSFGWVTVLTVNQSNTSYWSDKKYRAMFLIMTFLLLWCL